MHCRSNCLSARIGGAVVCVVVMLGALGVLPHVSASSVTEDVVIHTEAGQDDAWLEIPVETGEVFLVHPISMQLEAVEIPATNPFTGNDGVITVNAMYSVYTPDQGMVTVATSTDDDGPTTNCTLQAMYNPVTERWRFQCNPDAARSSDESCTLLRNGDPVVVGGAEGISDEDEIVYECDCLDDDQIPSE